MYTFSSPLLFFHFVSLETAMSLTFFTWLHFPHIFFHLGQKCLTYLTISFKKGRAIFFFFFSRAWYNLSSLLWCLPTATWKSLCTLTYHFQFTLNLLWYLPSGIVSFSIFNFSHQVFGHLPILISTFNNI